MSAEEEIQLDGHKHAAQTQAPAPQPRPSSPLADEDSGSVLESILRTPSERLIPWEIVELPSKGLYYGWDSGNIQVRPFTASLQRIMANQRMVASGTVLDAIFTESCQFPDGFSPEDLLLGDQAFLLYYLRNISFGPFYEFAVTCPNVNCRATSTHSFDMTELASTLSWGDPSIGPEPFRVDLPQMSKAVGRPVWVNVRFLRARDLTSSMRLKMAKRRTFGGNSVRVGGRKAEQRQRYQSDTGDSFIDNLPLSIVDVMGDDDRIKIEHFCEKLHILDVHAIRDFIESHMPGIEHTVAVTCNECQNEYTMSLPMTPEFFRPEKRRGTRT